MYPTLSVFVLRLGAWVALVAGAVAGFAVMNAGRTIVDPDPLFGQRGAEYAPEFLWGGIAIMVQGVLTWGVLNVLVYVAGRLRDQVSKPAPHPGSNVAG